MKAEAEANADADRETKERIEKLNKADGLVFQTEKQIKEYGDKIPAEKKETIEAAAAELKEAHKAEDMDRIDELTQKLNDAWAAASQEMYQATQEAQANAGGGAGPDAGADAGGSNDGGEDVTDVEFEEVTDDKA